ncbi:MAG: ATP-binding protein [Armatimonadota bacterium]
MLRRQGNGSPLTRRLLFGYTVPLVVLMVAGLALPVALWIWLDRYRVDFENQMVLTDRVASLRSAALDVQEKRLLAATTGAPARRRALADARDTYRNAAFRVREWLDTTENRPVRIQQQEADRMFRAWLRQPVATAEEFAATRSRFDSLLSDAASLERDLFDDFRQIQALRRTALIAFPILSVVLALLVGRTVAMGLVRPLIELTDAARRLERGEDAAGSLDPTLDPPDEIGDLRHSFRAMSSAIQGRESQLRSRNAALTAIGRRLEAVLNATDEGIAMLDPDGVLTLANDRFSELLDIDARPWLGRPFPAYARVLLRRFRRPAAVLGHLRLAIQGDQESSAETFELAPPKDRILRIFSAAVRSARSAGETPDTLGRIVVVRDVTRETEVDRMKTEFVSTVSHELRTPLTAIKGYVDLILGGQTGPLTDTQREFLTLTSASTERLTALINDILDISRIEQGGGNLRRVPVRYGPLLEHAVQMLDGQARARRLVLTADPLDQDVAVLGDPDRIAQVLFNLISNGIKYTPAGGRIHVRVETDAAMVTTRITDTGIGIASSDRERIFERFYRSDNSSTRAAGGTGLGLAISKAIVDRMQGTLDFDSEPGKGTTFVFTLPRATEDVDETAVPGNTAATMRLFLLVDADSDRRARTANQIRQHRVAVSLAASHAEALRRAKGLHPDLILVDPLSAGVDALRLIQDLAENDQTRSIPVSLIGQLDHCRLVGTSLSSDWAKTIAEVARDERAPIWVFGTDTFAGKVRDAVPNRWIVRPETARGHEAPPPLPAAVVTDLDAGQLIPAETLCTGSRPVWIVFANLPPTVRPIGSSAEGPVPTDQYVRRGLEHLRASTAKEAPKG